MGILCFILSYITCIQFRESGCENCPFFKMDEDPERVVDCTTPNFNGYFFFCVINIQNYFFFFVINFQF